MESNSKIPYITLSFNAQGTKTFYQKLIEQNVIVIGSYDKSFHIIDETVESKQLELRKSEDDLYTATDVSASYGSYIKIDQNTPCVIQPGQFIVIGKTWIIITFVADDPIIILINEKFKVVAQYKLNQGTKYSVGRSSTADHPIVISDDITVSSVHLYVFIEKKTITITDNNSTNGSFIKFSKMKLEKGKKSILRIGLETFAVFEYVDKVPSNKLLTPFLVSAASTLSLRVRNFKVSDVDL